MARGDHIKVARQLYDHHGIDVGNGEVIHYSGEMNAEKKNAVICRVSKAAFAAGGKVEIVIHEGNCFLPEETVQRAEKYLGDGLGLYDFLGNNCEHFAYWCKTGRRESKQVKRVENAVVGGIVGRGLVGLLGRVHPLFSLGLTVFSAYVGFSSDKEKTKPDDDPPKIEG